MEHIINGFILVIIILWQRQIDTKLRQQLSELERIRKAVEVANEVVIPQPQIPQEDITKKPEIWGQGGAS